jgi:hypothetical protein
MLVLTSILVGLTALGLALQIVGRRRAQSIATPPVRRKLRAQLTTSRAELRLSLTVSRGKQHGPE